jgi:hypothetical protein
MNTNYLESWFAVYNIAIFNSVISTDINIAFEDMTDIETIGYFDPETSTIGIADELDILEAKKTLLHEMIHAAEWTELKTCSHGSYFLDKSEKIYQTLGIEI